MATNEERQPFKQINSKLEQEIRILREEIQLAIQEVTSLARDNETESSFSCESKRRLDVDIPREGTNSRLENYSDRVGTSEISPCHREFSSNEKNINDKIVTGILHSHQIIEKPEANDSFNTVETGKSMKFQRRLHCFFVSKI